MTASEKPWEPSMKLRSSATDGQIIQRHFVLWKREGSRFSDPIAVARELASAVSLEKDAELGRLRHMRTQYEPLMAEITTLRIERAEKDAEIARLRRDAERLDALEAREYQIECMGTSVPYFNVWAKNGELFTTAETREKFTLRRAIDSAREAQ